ncbi:zinc-ribbon domain-containing protein [Haliea sp. E1-2-M8]|uniref:zinc-ribbon domain-containing protein n=1 Tax=Haliea sp. E1-2-M8 TaxID=3064706 RepID=UPI002727765D|nr:zinc-ribbon domain-containing protein [Haliea sp. E1-2-M8]MDO8864203.1 zinc-ribbon domain-containing protein [Haliea sp. E1-2-M8]
MLLDELHIAIEIDGSYWHSEKEESDTEKSKFLESQGYTVVRLRESPLKTLGKYDIAYDRGDRPNNLICKLLTVITSLCDQKVEGIQSYILNGKFLADQKYRKLVSQLPSPANENSLAEVYPKSKTWWDYERNDPLTPTMFLPASNKTVFWRCPKGHSWRKAIYAWVSVNDRCPDCEIADICLARIYPAIAQQWHPHRNGDVTPDKVTKRSDQKVWWICSAGHEWEATVAHRTKPRGCPECAGKKAGEQNNLRVMHPKIANEWHKTKNKGISPEDFTYGSSKKVWWQCPRSPGHEYQMPIKMRTGKQNSGCPYCAGRRASPENSVATQRPELALEWNTHKNGSLIPQEVTVQSGKVVWWRCAEGHEWEATIQRRSVGAGCPECKKETKTG